MAAIIAATGAAQAQDFSDWSGFYAGVYAGYGADKQEETSSSSLQTGGDIDTTVSFETSSDIVNEGTFLGEVRAGYNYQQGALVLGVEGSLGTGGLSKQRDASLTYLFDDVGDEDDYNLDFDFAGDMDIGPIGTATAKIGFVTGDWLIYGKGGLAVTHASTSSGGEGEYDLGAGEPVLFDTSGSTSGLLFGSTFAIGAETKVTEQVSLGAELGVTNFGLQDVTVPPITLPAIELPVGALVYDELDSWSILSAKVGVNYRF